MTALVLGALPAFASPAVEKLTLELSAQPKSERLTVTAHLRLSGMIPGDYSAVFSEPKSLTRFVDAKTGQAVPFKIVPHRGAPASVNFRILEFTITSAESSQELLLEYEYDRQSLSGFAPNPATHDNLHLGQLTSDSIFSSHLYYYPEMFGGSKVASIKITVPNGWTAVSSGALRSKTVTGSETAFLYEPDFHSGRLPYILAIYPYEVAEFVFAGRLPVSIYSSKADEAFALQKLETIESKILPFLETLMGPFPFDTLKVIEVFPWEGNTGLAAKGVVMMSQKMWFAADIDDEFSTLPATVLVDEIAHQWNFYKIQMPNYLAEGVSQFTDSLFTEHIRGATAYAQEMRKYRDSYSKIADLLNSLKPLKAQGLSIEEAAKKLNMPADQIRPYWPFAENADVGIADPRVLPALYFLKGALALDALRSELGEGVFFRAFKKLFEESKLEDEVTLDEFRSVFELESGKNLKSFFDLWYFSSGLPN